MLSRVTILICGILLLAAGVSDADNNWRKSTSRSDNNWHTPANWSEGLPAAHYCNIGHDSEQPQGAGPTVSTSDATAGTVRMRSRVVEDPGLTLTITSTGHLTLTTGGLSVGFDTSTYGPKEMTVDVDGGMLTTTNLGIGEDYGSIAGTKGVVNILGGVVKITNIESTALNFQNDPETSRVSELNLDATGLLYWNGDHTASGDDKIATYIAANQILGPGGAGAGDVHYELVTGGEYDGYTKVYIPEPATVAILGLGSIALLRRRRV